MGGQNQIQRTLSQPHSLVRVAQLLLDNPDMNRSQLADHVCDEFGFIDATERRQRSGCLKALRVLESREHFVLPSAQSNPGPVQPRRLKGSVALPREVPGTVEEVRGLELVLVETEEQMRIWNTLFIEEHPRGAGPLVGRQLRYLIVSEHGWLGGIGFASAALHLAARDRWVGWNLGTRCAQLERIVGMARFLIRPSVSCRNLASRILAQAMKLMPQDFEARYGYQPWLVETFVDTTQVSGTCYRAANWIRVGQSQGRGRQDREKKSPETIKDIYVHVLVKDFRDRLGLPAHSGLGPLPLGTGLESENWAEREFGDAPLGDKRLSKRLVQSAKLQGDSPTLSFPAAAKGDKTLVKGHYRLLDQPDDSAVTMENILLPHRQQTIRRMKDQKMVLCIQDGSSLNYNGAAECKGLGAIGSNQTGAKSLGLHLHSTLVVNDEGLPLGVLQSQCEAPKSKDPDDTRSAAKIPIEEKKTFAWILGMRDCEAIASDMPHTRILQVMDREADIFELFDQWQQGPRNTDLLVRAKHNRQTTNTKNPKLFDGVQATDPCLKIQLSIGRQSARLKKSKQKARPKRVERTAIMTLRYQQAELKQSSSAKDEPVSLWVVHLKEETPPTGVKPVEWFLLTTMEITSPEQAERLVGWYCLRWRIEDWHRVLKSGCGIEELRNETADRLKRALAIYLVIAWRVMLMTLLSRESPELPPEVLFTDIELTVLQAFAKSRRDLKTPTNLRDVVWLVARMGGYMARKNDPPPGHQVIWIGYSQLQFMCAGYLLGRQDSES